MLSVNNHPLIGKLTMNCDRDDADLVSAVDAFAVQTYLLRTGWREKEVVVDRHIILSNSRGSRNFLIFLPLNKDIPNFSNRMLELFKVLEAFEQKQQLRIIANFVDIKAL